MTNVTVLVTSYNRPNLLRRALYSLVNQQDPEWRAIVLDDGSDEPTLAVLREFLDDRRFDIRSNQVDEAARYDIARYAHNLNAGLDAAPEGVVMYLTDKCEFHPLAVAAVRAWFAANPSQMHGYLRVERDVWKREGRDSTKRLGPAWAYGNFPMLPPYRFPVVHYGGMLGKIDTVSIAHRVPISVRWPEEIETLHYGDAEFSDRLIDQYGPMFPILYDKPLVYQHTLPKLERAVLEEVAEL